MQFRLVSERALLVAALFISACLSFPNVSMAGPPTGIVLYDGAGLTGGRVVINEDAVDVLSNFNDKTSSFQIHEGTWVLYDDDGWWADSPGGTTGPLGPGIYEGPGFGVTSLRRMSENGITLFNETYLRGFGTTFLTSTRFNESTLNDDFNSAWIPPNQGNQWRLYEDVWSGFSDYFPALKTGAVNVIPPGVSSVYRDGNQDHGLTEVEYPITDEALLRPTSRVAVDSLLSPGGIATDMQIRLNGFFGVDHTTCAGQDFYHPQHLVRLENKNGRAYFMVAHSSSSANSDRAAGRVAIFRMDADALDPDTDLVIDTPGTDGEYVWTQNFTSSSPFGDWNHPGKMAVVGDVLVVAGEQWDSHFCEARDGSAEDAVLFYDLRDPENPLFWGRIDASELDINFQIGNVSFGLPGGDDFNSCNVQRYFMGNVCRQAISKLSLDLFDGQYLLSVGNNNDDRQRIFRARNGVVLPYASNWEFVGTGGLTGAHGINYVSREANGNPASQPGTERLMFFDGREQQRAPCNLCDPIWAAMVTSNVFFTPEGGSPSFRLPADGPFTVSRVSARAPASFPAGARLHKAEDTASLYVNQYGRPVVYAPASRDPYNPRGQDYANDVGIDGVVGDLISGPRSGYYNQFAQTHFYEPDSVVGSFSELQQAIRGGTSELITFEPSLDGQTIDFAAETINRRLVIDASSLPNGITLDAASFPSLEPLISIGENGHLSLINVRLTDSSGRQTTRVAAIENLGVLELTDVEISNHRTRALINFGDARIYNSTIANNSDASGAGIFQFSNTENVPSLLLRNVTFSGNVTEPGGAGGGGAIYSLGGSIDAANCTISDSNSAGSGPGAGIYFALSPLQPDAMLRLTHCTVLNDVVIEDTTADQVELRNNIIERLEGDVLGITPNLVTVHNGINSGPEAIVTAPNLGLGPLANNIGRTQTMLPQMGSPAIDRGVYIAEFERDQRGIVRAFPDLGAAETPDLNLRALTVTGTRLVPDYTVPDTEYTATTSFRNTPRLRADQLDDDGVVDRFIDFRVNGGDLFRIGDPARGLARPELDLEVGFNTVEIIVRSLDETISKTYTITVEREAPDSNTDLQWLATSALALIPSFDSSTNTYDAGTTSKRELRVWAQSRVSHARVELREDGGEFFSIPGPGGLSSGANHNVVVDINNNARAWGSNLRLTDRAFTGQARPLAANLDNPRAVAAGGSHSLQVSLNGQVQAWGSNEFGQTDLPPLEGVLEVAAGLNHSLALQSINGGIVVAWGDNARGQTDVPPGLTGVVRIAAGSAHSVALKNDGTVVAWGDNSEGQTDVPFSVRDVVAISAGFDFTLALLADGTVERWGSSLSNGLTNVPSSLADVVDIGAGGDGTQDVNLALRSDGQVIGWGALADCEIEGVVDGVVDLSAGGRHRAAILETGRPFAWGSNSLQQLNVPAQLSVATPGSALVSLLPGANVIDVRVTAESGAQEIYQITVNQDDSATTDQLAAAPNSLFSVREGSQRFFENPNLVGLTVSYRVTGATNGFIAGGLMGTPYTLDTGIATAAVHAGIVMEGEQGLVSLRVVATPTEIDENNDNFIGGLQNGINSRSILSMDPETAYEIRPFTGDPTQILREQFDVEPGLPPTDFRCYGSRTGQTLIFLAYGAAPADSDNPPSKQVLWYQASNDRYTADSPLAVAAVHAGVLQKGALGLVAVTFGEGFSFVRDEVSDDTRLQNGVRPSRRGDNHSSFVNGSYTLTSVLAFDPDDSDGDGIDDATEALLVTDPDQPDSDLDGMPDGWEIDQGLDPLTPDAGGDDDMDDLTNIEEYRLGTRADDEDSDGDLMPDGWEVANGLNPTVSDAGGDPDNDQKDNLTEFRDGTDPQVFNVAVRELAPPQIDVSVEEIDFGAQPLGSSSSPGTVTLTNLGEQTLDINALVISGANAADYSIPAASDSCSGETLEAEQSCSFDVVFTPQDSSVRNARIEIRSTDPDGTRRISLTGTSGVLFADGFEGD